MGVLLAVNTHAAIVVMPRVDVSLFVNNGRTDFHNICNPDTKKTEEKVNWLFEQNLLDHDFSKAVSPELSFSAYWKHFASSWHALDIDGDGEEELLFSGKPLLSEEKERIEIFVQYGSVWKQIFWDDGYLMAYKKHPNTHEILLYHHRYPCCSHFTHMVQRIRIVRNRLYFTKRYFLARDTEMQGQFFPKRIHYPNRYRQLKKDKMLYWSKGVIAKSAARFSPSNQIIHFPQDAFYQLLAREGAWAYVMMVSPPKIEESLVANAHNLQESRFYGWIKL